MNPQIDVESTRSLTPKGEATRARIIDAATAEFAAFGIAGARVDRIAGEARSNKAQLYAYFGSKDGLFDAVFFGSFDHIMGAVPIDADDLADWAVRLYDHYLQRPDHIRLATWARLERRPTGHLTPDADRVDATKLDQIAQAQRAGLVVGGVDPFDVMAMVIAMSMAWSPVSNVYAASADEAAELHDRRRELLRESVVRVVRPHPPTS
ncbi:MAG: TetR family transcriptional regulator [Nocardioidaceae bacterium]|nr:TetR family transcriptional regulator [Nocardioidaceae bacterium]